MNILVKKITIYLFNTFMQASSRQQQSIEDTSLIRTTNRQTRWISVLNHGKNQIYLKTCHPSEHIIILFRILS